jgi:sporulation protein YlmC with PRC-barrel domain
MRHLLYIICAIVLGGCNNGRNVPALNDVVFDSIPSNAYFVAENEDWKILLNDEAIGDSIEGVGAVKQMSLWAYNKSKKSVKKLMMSHPHANGSWFTMEHAVKIPLDSIPTITKVIILSWEGEPLKLFAEGTSDFRNILSFIIDTNSDKAICLPTNRGLIGVSEEDALLIMQSYAYYEDGGRFNVIEAFDAVYGNRISTMEARVRNN